MVGRDYDPYLTSHYLTKTWLLIELNRFFMEHPSSFTQHGVTKQPLSSTYSLPIWEVYLVKNQDPVLRFLESWREGGLKQSTPLFIWLHGIIQLEGANHYRSGVHSARGSLPLAFHLYFSEDHQSWSGDKHACSGSMTCPGFWLS